MALHAWRSLQKGKAIVQQSAPSLTALLQSRSAGTHAENTNTFIKEVRSAKAPLKNLIVMRQSRQLQVLVWDTFSLAYIDRDMT